MILTTPTEADLPGLASFWHAMWHVAHADHVPAAFLAKRQLASFLHRLGPALPSCRIAQDDQGYLGFCQVTCSGAGELDQLFVAERAWGTGLAQTLLADGEARLAASGCTTPFLYCLPENTRARAFYRRAGWRERGLETVPLKTEDGVFHLPTIVHEKRLDRQLCSHAPFDKEK